MLKSIKLTIVVPGIVLALGLIGTAIFSNTSVTADTRDNVLKSLQDQFKVEETKLEKMPNKTKKEMDKTIEQGMKIKALGKEAGKLREELDPLAVFEERLNATEAAISDPVMFHENDPQYEKAKNLQEKNKKQLKNIRATLEAKMKQKSIGEQVSLDDINKELDDILNSRPE